MHLKYVNLTNKRVTAHVSSHVHLYVISPADLSDPSAMIVSASEPPPAPSCNPQGSDCGEIDGMGLWSELASSSGLAYETNGLYSYCKHRYPYTTH